MNVGIRIILKPIDIGGGLGKFVGHFAILALPFLGKSEG